ncbi:hypothetical protein ACNOYE_16245 [Nannocystaceae bacterium ST9]
MARKLEEILDSPIIGASSPAELFVRLHVALSTHLVHVSGDPLRDVDRIDLDVDPAFDPNIAIYQGHWSNSDSPRLQLAVQVLGHDVHIALRATKQDANAEETEFGDTGPKIGNSVLVARMLHVGICTLRSAGIRDITNEPHDERLRSYYSTLGFVDGKVLSLHDRGQLKTALMAIRSVYARFGLDLAAPPP